MLWVKAFHVIFMVTWFAGLFYLPRLFVYHAMAEDQTSIERFKVMERKLFYGINDSGRPHYLDTWLMVVVRLCLANIRQLVLAGCLN